MAYAVAGGSVWIKAMRLCPLDQLGNPQVGGSAFITDIAMKLTLTPVTPSIARTALPTPSWKWLRIGQPAVVSETITSITPLGWMSIERTICSSTMSRRNSGSMTERSASVT